MVKQFIFEAFLDDPGSDSHFRHVTTYGGTPVCAAVSLRSIEILERENLCERAAEMGDYLLGKLKRLLEHPNVGDVRGKGLLLGVELVKDKVSKTPLDSDAVASVTKYCMEKQIIIGRNTNTIPGFTNVLILAPPLVISREEADRLADTLCDAVFTLPSS